jgi:hypothetical protein
MSDGSDRWGDDETFVDGEPDRPTRVCPHCATVARTAGDYCSHCGKSYATKPRLSRRARIVVIAGAAVLLLAGAGAAIAIKHNQDQENKRKHALALAAVRARKLRAEEAQRESEDEQKLKRDSEERERRSDETELERAVEVDAKKLVTEEALSEPILGASCTPASGGSSVDLSSPTGSYSCIAITKREAGGEVSGYRFSGTIDFASGRFTYHLGGS